MSARVRRRGRHRLTRATIERETTTLARLTRGCTCELTIDIAHHRALTVATLHHDDGCPALEAEGVIYTRTVS